MKNSMQKSTLDISKREVFIRYLQKILLNLTRMYLGIPKLNLSNLLQKFRKI